MTPKHTPGPWHFNSELSKHNTKLIYDSSGKLVADAGRIASRTYEEMEANANLIAAAPELLEALKRSLPLLRENFYDLSIESKDYYLKRSMWSEAKAAIDKAEGK